MYFQQFYLECLSHASYLIADEETGVAAVVDPQRDVDLYVREAEEHGWRIEHVFLTHFHADFLAGHIELRDRLGAHIYLGARAEAEYDFTPLKEGDVIEFGNVRLTALETPGHTPEGISILVHDLSESDTLPHAVLTGDTLFIGDVGRPDLLASIGVTADELANMLYDSVGKLRQLPDETRVYPAHGAGSLCGKQLSSETVSTIGEQKLYNYALRPMSREEFVKLVETDQPDAPDYFAYDAIKNRQERPTLDQSMKDTLVPLSVDDVRRLHEEGAQLLDVRDSRDFEGAHLIGSINVGLDGKYATWAGTVLDHERPIVVIADAGREEEAVTRLGRIGFDNVAGFLDGGVPVLQSQHDLVGNIQRITAPALWEVLGDPEPPLVFDVRTASEWAGGHVPGSVNVPLNILAQRPESVRLDRNLVVHCQGGYRSAIAASLLRKYGYTNVYDLVGGYGAWTASKLPTAATVPEAV